MRTIYTEVMKRLQSEVPALNGIELDFGQLELAEREETLAIAYPYAFIDIFLPECSDISEKTQTCTCTVSVAVAFEPFGIGATSSNAAEEDRNVALSPYDIISDIYKALQGYETKEFNALSRISQGKENYEKLFVYRLDFNCCFDDLTAVE
jgi:hypothetical protein